MTCFRLWDILAHDYSLINLWMGPQQGWSINNPRKIFIKIWWQFEVSKSHYNHTFSVSRIALTLRCWNAFENLILEGKHVSLVSLFKVRTSSSSCFTPSVNETGTKLSLKRNLKLFSSDEMFLLLKRNAMLFNFEWSSKISELNGRSMHKVRHVKMKRGTDRNE